eukprot:CAMPEP_0174938572 /NCGR_PEP_ID=MMETSP1355-20121228/63897_1 /TAXON_ID=464990 /ORGANISM="Hemiselmis tepida, Strain CCMP443" /LENGTH=244 /DNA_ID=CAMNT_0016185507 /DNA_START=131 /DNA_END=862 /DNA_ORIENTATION=-
MSCPDLWMLLLSSLADSQQQPFLGSADSYRPPTDCVHCRSTTSQDWAHPTSSSLSLTTAAPRPFATALHPRTMGYLLSVTRIPPPPQRQRNIGGREPGARLEETSAPRPCCGGCPGQPSAARGPPEPHGASQSPSCSPSAAPPTPSAGADALSSVPSIDLLRCGLDCFADTAEIGLEGALAVGGGQGAARNFDGSILTTPQCGQTSALPPDGGVLSVDSSSMPLEFAGVSTAVSTICTVLALLF